MKLKSKDRTISVKRLKKNISKGLDLNSDAESVSSKTVDFELARSGVGRPVDTELDYFSTPCKKNNKIMHRCNGINEDGERCIWTGS